jgi:hypothetical protein
MKTNSIGIVLLVVAAAMLLSSLPAEAHHSFSGTYDVSKEITLKGKIVEITFRSPHSFFYVEVEDSQGTPQRWAIEAASAAQFQSQGVTRSSFLVGDPVEVIANPARSATVVSYRARLLKIVRTTDGKSWGSRPGETFQ